MATAITVLATITLDRIDHSKKLGDEGDTYVMDLLEEHIDGEHVYDDEGYEYELTVQKVEVVTQ